METSLMVKDYPEPKEETVQTLKVKCYFTTYVTVYGDDYENYEEQIKNMDKYDLVEETDKIEIDDWEVVR